MNRMNLLRLLVVGCGAHANETLVPAIASLGRARIVGFCDLNRDRADSAAHRFSVMRSGTSPIGMIDELRPDAVILAGPPSMHVDVALYALQAGSHVLVEKPPATSTGELRRLAAATEASSLIGMVAHNLRYTAAWRSAVERTPLARVESITIEYHASGPIGERWGLLSHEAFLLSHAIHVFDLLNFTLGSSVMTTHHVKSVGDGRFVLSTQWHSQRDVVGVAVVSTCAPRFDWNVQLVTADGCLARITSSSGVTFQDSQSGDLGVSGWRNTWRSRSLEAGYDSAGYGAELMHFFDCIDGVGVASPSFTEELAVYQALDELYRQTGLARSSSDD